jgi:AbrB family looped-hinge helix DNA binding protein
MATATLTSKGRITVPKKVRDQLCLSAGDRIRFLSDGEGRVVMVPATILITELRGCLPAPKRAVTLAEMDETIATAASGELPRRKR